MQQLFEFLAQFIHLFRFHCVVESWQRGVVLRLGKPHRDWEPGLHFYWPFGIEQPYVCPVVTDADVLEAQSLTTKDGVDVVLRATVTWEVKDARKFMLEVMERDGAFRDAAYGTIGAAVRGSTWAEMREDGWAERVGAKVRRKAFRFGVEVVEVQFKDFSRTKSLRLITDAAPPPA